MNRRGFFGALLGLPVAAAAVAASAPRALTFKGCEVVFDSPVRPAVYMWGIFHDGFAVDEAELEEPCQMELFEDDDTTSHFTQDQLSYAGRAAIDFYLKHEQNSLLTTLRGMT